MRVARIASVAKMVPLFFIVNSLIIGSSVVVIYKRVN